MVPILYYFLLLCVVLFVLSFAAALLYIVHYNSNKQKSREKTKRKLRFGAQFQIYGRTVAHRNFRKSVDFDMDFKMYRPDFLSQNNDFTTIKVAFF